MHSIMLGLALVVGVSLQQPDAPAANAAPTPVGLWQTVSDKGGQAQSVVRIYEEEGQLFAKVERLLVSEDVPDTCVKCKDERKGQPLLGLVIMRNMKPSGDEWKGGDILDPESGKIYRCKLKLDETGNRVTVRGYIGISLFGRSQTWHRVE